MSRVYVQERNQCNRDFIQPLLVVGFGMIQSFKLFIISCLRILEGLNEPFELPIAIIELNIISPDDHVRGVLIVLAGREHVAG